MGKVQNRLHPRRVFTGEVKRQAVQRYELGEITIREMSTLYNVHLMTAYRWVYKYSVLNKQNLKVVENTRSKEYKLNQMQSRISALEQLVGQKQIKIEYLEKMIELVGQHYGIDVKKNFDTPHSDGSELTGKE